MLHYRSYCHKQRNVILLQEEVGTRLKKNVTPSLPRDVPGQIFLALMYHTSPRYRLFLIQQLNNLSIKSFISMRYKWTDFNFLS